MSPALRDYAVLWPSASASRDPRAKWIFHVVTLALTLTVGFLVWARTGMLFDALKYAVRVPAAVYLFAALTYYVPGAILLNTPANARLVPRMRRRLVELTLGVWVAAVVVAALLAWDTAAPAGLVAVATFAWLIGLGLGSAGYQIGVLMQAAVPLLVISRQVVPEILFAQPFAAGIVLLLLALGARTIDLMFPNGGDRHWTRRRAHARAMERTRPEGLMRQAANARFAGTLYVAALRRNATARRAPGFLLPVLGPALHWTQRYMPLLALVGLAAVLIALVKGFGGDLQFARKWVLLLCQGLLFAQLFTYAQRSQRLADTRTEQSVLRLAPSLPAAARPFNRRLNASLLGMALLDWLAILATLLAVAALAGSPWELLVFLAQICCLTLPLVAANVRNYARHTGSGILLLVAGLVAAVLCSLGVAALLHWLAATPVMPVAASVSIVLAVSVVAWRWRAALDAPHAFPAGRLA
jgi:hypothetical protein